MSNLKTYTFAITQADVASGGDTAVAASWVNIPIVAEGTIEYTVQKVEVADGEGKLQINWFHTQRAKVTLRMKQYAFRILEMVTNSPVSSAQGTDAMYFGRDEEITPPYVRLRLQQKAVDASSGARGYFEVIVFKAQGTLPTLTMKEVSPGEYTVMFDCLQATYDDSGNAIPSAMLKVKALKSSLA